jgi:DNA-binding IclR family transcriptional regulator
MTKPHTEKRTIQSDKRLFSIIELLQERDGAGVTEIADALELAKSTVHGHLTTMEQSGYVIKHDGEYYIGLRFLDHGSYAKQSKDLLKFARPKVKELAEKTGERAWCVVEENGYGIYLEGVKGANAVQTYAHPGMRTHLHHLASGKAILSKMPDERVKEIISSNGIPRRTNKTIIDADELFNELEDIRNQGYACNIQESIDGVNAVGAPIYEESSGVSGALSVSGPAHRINEKYIHETLSQLILGVTNEIEINIKYR